MKKFVPALAFALGLGITSCVNDLDVTPIDPNLDLSFSAEGLFNKCYANFSMQGNNAGNEVDIDGMDGGTVGLVRQLFNSNELTTDEAICGWGDAGISEFCFNTYGDQHPMLSGYYSRLTTGISYCNQYLSVASGYDATMTAEVRFLRAFQYYLIMDAWGYVPFATEPLASPEQLSREKAFAWLEDELLDLSTKLSPAKAKKSTDAGYGRVDQAAANLLLARLYLNAEVYTGTAKWNEAKTYAKKVMDSDYKLHTQGEGGWSAYQMLFMGNNGESNAAYEGIFPLLQGRNNNGTDSHSWCSSLFLVASIFDADVHANPQDESATNNTDQAWGGNRVRPDLLKKFGITDDMQLRTWEMTKKVNDDRALFDGVGRLYDNADAGVFTNGYATTKFNNWKSDGSAASHTTFTDMDFFILRKAEAYLTFAEADARLNNGVTTSEGTAAVNAVVERAHAATKAMYTTDDMLDEWAREFFFEGRRRMDLIRFNKYGGNNDYLWTWKGGTHDGSSFAATRNVFAIPSTVITANKFVQNAGY